jgi:hypothetical protein
MSRAPRWTDPPIPARLAWLEARDAPIAVVFRRGPSRWVELVSWDLEHDVFERGAWFHGRIYERRCDLSPDGTKLLYFARKYGEPKTIEGGYTESWTAISRPPWLTALALWPKGDSWHGGGAFLDDRRVLLNHRPEYARPHPNHLPVGLTVEPDPGARGEDDPLFSRRLERDGWMCIEEGHDQWVSWAEGYVTEQPQILERACGDLRIVKRREMARYEVRETFTLAGATVDEVPLEAADWVDWDRRGRLIVLRAGKIEVRDVVGGHVGEARILLDLSADAIETRKSPPWAASWGRRPGSRTSRRSKNAGGGGPSA